MAANFYDEALLKKIQYWVGENTNVTILGPNETRRLFEVQLDTKNDKPIQLPLISLSRGPNMEILSIAKKPLTYDGYRSKGIAGKVNRVDQLNGIPIKLEYQLDIYTRYYEEAEEYVRQFIFNIINYPKLSIEIPYNDAKISHVSNIRLDTTVQDNSDVPERLIVGQFTRKTISIYIDDAYLFSYNIKEAGKIENTKIEIKYNDKIEVENN